MKRRLLRASLVILTVVLLATLGTAVGLYLTAPIANGASVSSCTPQMNVQTCVIGKETILDPGSDTGTQWQVLDKNGAPMAWVNLYGLYSGGLGNRMPGGLICVTYGVWQNAACMTPAGNLELTPTSPNGNTGPKEILTPGDIAYVHSLRAAGITAAKLRLVMQKLGVH
jgi:hypothetical protein